MSHEPGEIQRAIKAGYRVTVHASFSLPTALHFPFPSRNPIEGTIHAVVDHGARAIFCSAEWAKTHEETKSAT